MGMFDDLLGNDPATTKASSAPVAAKTPGMFDDLLQAEPPIGTPKKSGGLFDDLLQDPQLTPAQRPAVPPTDGTPFWSVMKGAVTKGLVEGAHEVQQTAQQTAAMASGQPFFTQEKAPDFESEADPWLKMKLFEGWSDPRWWGAQMAHGFAKSSPELAVAVGGSMAGGAAGGMVGGPPGAATGALLGGAAGFGASSTVLALIPAFQDAKRRGLSDDDAIKEASMVAAVSGGTAALMGLAPMLSFTGKAMQMTSNAAVAGLLERPIAEAFVQLGLVQPTLGVLGSAATTVIQKRELETEDLLTSYAVNAGLGAVIMGGHKAIDIITPKAPSLPPDAAALAGLADASTGLVPLPPAPPPKGAVIWQHNNQMSPPSGPVFYSQVERTIRASGTNSASPAQWLATLRNAPGVKGIEIDALGLPEYLTGHDGKVSKSDLLAHIEESQIELKDVILEDSAGTLKRSETDVERQMAWLLDPQGDQPASTKLNTGYSSYRAPGPFEKYGEFHLTKAISPGEKALFTSHPDIPGTGHHALSPNTIGIVRYTTRTDRDGRPTLFAEEVQRSDWLKDFAKYGTEAQIEKRASEIQEKVKGIKVRPGDDPILRILNAIQQKKITQAEGGFLLRYDEGRIKAVAEPPFQSNWHELMVKRIVRHAADMGYERVAFSDGKTVAARYLGSNEATKTFLMKLYDREIPAVLQKLSRQTSSEVGRTAFSVLDKRNGIQSGPEIHANMMNISPQSRSNIQRGFSTYEKDPSAAEGKWDAGNQAITNFMESKARNAWVQVPEGQLYLRQRKDPTFGLVLDISNLSFDIRGTGAFTAYLDNMHRQLLTGGKFDAIFVENILNERLVPFFERRGYIKAESWGAVDGVPSMVMPKSRLEMLGPSEPISTSNSVMQINTPGAGTALAGLGAAPVHTGAPSYSPQHVLAIRNSMHISFKALLKVVRQLGIKETIRLEPEVNQSNWGSVGFHQDGSMTIRINFEHMPNAERAMATLAHEFGHVIEYKKYYVEATKDPALMRSIMDEHDIWRAKQGANAKPPQPLKGALVDALDFQYLRLSRDQAVKVVTEQIDKFGFISMKNFTPAELAYWYSFSEWMAESTARWLTTADKPLSVVDHFFSAMGTSLRDMFQEATRLTGGKFDFTAPKNLRDYLDASIPKMAPLGPLAHAKTLIQTQQQNQAALAANGTPGVNATPIGPATMPTRKAAQALGAGANPAVRAMAAHADRFNKLWEWTSNIYWLAQNNLHIRGLQMYVELMGLAHTQATQIKSEAFELTVRAWQKLGRKDELNLRLFMDDYMNGRFMPAAQRVNGLRKPTAVELQTMVQRHGLTNDAVRVATKVFKDFDVQLTRWEEVLMGQAQRIRDPLAQANAITDVQREIAALRRKPYLPAFRYGDYTVTLYDANHNIREFHTFENQRDRDSAWKEIDRTKLPGETADAGFLKKDARPLQGMPPGLLDLMANKLNLSAYQHSVLDQLKFQYAPSQSFRHSFQNKSMVKGYSHNFLRAYSNYFHHGANWYVKTKYADTMREMIQQVENEKYIRADSTKVTQIRNFMSEHLDQWLDPKPEFGRVGAFAFHMMLGFNAASAALNLTQVPLMSFPFLANKFGGLGVGDARAMAAIARAATAQHNYMSKGKILQSAAPHLWAMQEGIRDGTLSETQAHELAAIGEGRNLFFGVGGNAGERGWQKFSEASAKMFELTEQWNRRVSFQAAYDLALSDPANRHVADVVAKNQIAMHELMNGPLRKTFGEAAAYVTAKDAVAATQFTYAPHTKPKLLWGYKGALFVFKNFMLNSLYNLWSHPGAAGRSLVILGVLGGAMGLPGAEDLNGLIKGLAHRLFGKDFDPSEKAREFIVDMAEGKISPDIFLHGVSKYGFGVPAMADMAGELIGVRSPVPNIDMSRNISMGNILPVEPGKLLTPVKDVPGNEVRQIQRASGAVFGLGFSVYNFLNSRPIEEPDLKKWEGIFPRAVANLSAASRYYTEGMERNKAGAPIVRFDPYDTQQMAEIVARGLGFQPSRVTSRWDNILAKAEAVAYWDIRREVLLHQYYAAYKSGNPELVESVRAAIINFNNQLPEEARGKTLTGKQVSDSVRNKLTNSIKTEAGIPPRIGDLGIYKKIDKYYPDGAPPNLVDIQKVR